jgi:hypothetical protein
MLSYGNDKGNTSNTKDATRSYSINENAPQLEEGSEIELYLKYVEIGSSGVGSFDKYGLVFTITSYSTNNASLTIGTHTSNNDVFHLSAKEGQSGRNNNISYLITIKDGSSTYCVRTTDTTPLDASLDCVSPQIAIFHRIEGAISVSNATIKANDAFILTGWNALATADENILNWRIADTFLSDRKMISNITEGFVLKLTATQKYNGHDIFFSTEVKFSAVIYMNNTTILTALTEYKKEGASITILGANNCSKSGSLSEYQTLTDTYSEKAFNYVQTGWSSNKGDKSFGEKYNEYADITLVAKWIAPMVTLYLYEGSIEMKEDKGQNHTSTYSVSYDIASLKALGYTNIQINMQIEVRCSGTPPLYEQDIWFDINNNRVWEDMSFDISSKTWVTVEKTTTISIERFTQAFNFRFGFESKGEFAIYNDGWWFNEGVVTFTAKR